MPTVLNIPRVPRVNPRINVVAVGRPGVRKSHLLASLGHVLIQQGTTVLWQSTAQLVQRLLAAKRDLRLPQELAKLRGEMRARVAKSPLCDAPQFAQDLLKLLQHAWQSLVAGKSPSSG